jgi:hypothetical protein
MYGSVLMPLTRHRVLYKMSSTSCGKKAQLKKCLVEGVSMSRSLSLVAVILLLVAARVMAQPPGCRWEGDPVMRFGWGATWAGWQGYVPPSGYYHQPGNDTIIAVAGDWLDFKLGPGNAATSWTRPGCNDSDTLCFEIQTEPGWAIFCDPSPGTPVIVAPGYLWTQKVTLHPPCSDIGKCSRIIATCTYVNSANACDPTCGDCVDPDVSPATGHAYFSKDTLWVWVFPPDIPPPDIFQGDSTFVEVERGQPQACIPFDLCNGSLCFFTSVSYHIWSMGHVGAAINISGSLELSPLQCKEIYGIIDASTSSVCTYDTLHVEAWITDNPLARTSCKAVIHVIEPRAVPIFTVPVVTILVFALILAAAVFMRRRAVSKA